MNIKEQCATVIRSGRKVDVFLSSDPKLKEFEGIPVEHVKDAEAAIKRHQVLEGEGKSVWMLPLA